METEPDCVMPVPAPCDGALLIAIVECGGHRFGLDLTCVGTIMMPQAALVAPDLPPGVLGVLAMRRRLTPLVDFSRLAGRGERADRSAERLVIVNTSRITAALRVDRVADIAIVPRDAIRPERPQRGFPEGCITGEAAVGDDDRPVYMLDVGRVLDACCTGGLKALRRVQFRAERSVLAAEHFRRCRAA